MLLILFLSILAFIRFALQSIKYIYHIKMTYIGHFFYQLVADIDINFIVFKSVYKSGFIL